jgi:hypothetical protein
MGGCGRDSRRGVIQADEPPGRDLPGHRPSPNRACRLARNPAALSRSPRLLFGRRHLHHLGEDRLIRVAPTLQTYAVTTGTPTPSDSGETGGGSTNRRPNYAPRKRDRLVHNCIFAHPGGNSGYKCMKFI